MYLKVHCLVAFVLSIAMALANAAARAQAAPSQSPASPAVVAPIPSVPQTTGTLRGHITDPSGALIPGTQVTITSADGKKAANGTADAAGAYQVHGLPAGSYVIQATFEGFAPFVSQPISLAAGQIKNVDIKMAIEAAQQQVVVTEEEGPTVSTDAENNASAMVLKGADLDALSDDPDELSNELTALAGPSAGPNGGQIYIDGFTGGQLPPKSAIREIRINQNPFSAEFDRIGYGRIEILTKPGTDKLHGRVYAQGNQSGMNTGNPFLSPLPSYYSYQYNGSVSGALSKTASFFFSVQQRNVQDDSIFDFPNDAPIYNPSTGLYTEGSLSGSINNPSNRFNVSPRIDLQFGQKNTLTTRYQFFRNTQSGNINSLALPSTAGTSETIEHALQMDDTQIINDRVVNETRFEYRRANSTSTPVSVAPSINVAGSFSGGGSGAQSSSSHSDHYELQNFVTMTAGAHAIKFGAWLRDNREAQSTNGNFNGSFTFPSVTAYIDTVNGLAQGKTLAQIAAACPSTQQGGCVATNLTYTTGPLGFKANVFDGALFFQDDWKYNKFLTLSGGLRWETQNHTADHSDWGPRVAVAYALDGHKKGASKTVLRGGAGFFYDRFAVGSLMNLEQFSGTAGAQQQISITDPSCFNGTSLSAIPGGVASCGSGSAISPVINTITPHYRAPYTEQYSASIERQLTKVSTLTFTYMRSSGFHQLVTRDSNAYLPGDYIYNASGAPTILAPRPDPNLGIVDQYYPEAVFGENQIIVNFNSRFSQNLSLSGFYTASWAKSDGGEGSNPTNSYNLRQDYGRAGFIRPQWVFLVGNYSGKWGISYSPFIIFQGGRPYNLTTPYDLTGDSFFNSRPSYANGSSNSNDVVDTSFGSLNTIPQPGESLVPANLGNSPDGFAVNLRVSRSFGVGPKVEETTGPRPGGGFGPGGDGPPGGGGFGGGGGRGGGGGGFGGGGFGGGFGGGGPRGGGPRGGSANTGRRYSLQFSAQALNLFNNIDLGMPVGNVRSPGFGQSTGLAGGIFSTKSASRRIFIQAAFQF